MILRCRGLRALRKDGGEARTCGVSMELENEMGNPTSD